MISFKDDEYPHLYWAEAERLRMSIEIRRKNENNNRDTR